ncbi:hypothetical protein NP493_328g04062 [Ridgeia piscesae]|uniref:Uncharacterized protein n=1 Tax=Ridgeia piscesae TaxID=27915 RepID=A0AAD9L439_RIDPI|nr:hypothetical protein NP493_328g04062 [Ridgeia piscesae]
MFCKITVRGKISQYQSTSGHRVPAPRSLPFSVAGHQYREKALSHADLTVVPVTALTQVRQRTIDCSLVTSRPCRSQTTHVMSSGKIREQGDITGWPTCRTVDC